MLFTFLSYFVTLLLKKPALKYMILTQTIILEACFGVADKVDTPLSLLVP